MDNYQKRTKMNKYLGMAVYKEMLKCSQPDQETFQEIKKLIDKNCCLVMWLKMKNMSS